MLRIILLTLFYTCLQSLSAQEFSTTFFGETQGGDYLPEYIAGLPDGGAYIVGQTNRSISGGYHVLLIRSDAQGNRLWERVYHAGTGTWVAATADGGCVLGGYALRHPFGTEQGFVSKIDAQGELIWTQYFPQGNHSEIREVKPLANGEYAVCGIVSQPDSTGQNVFWARLSVDGGLAMYIEMALEGVEFNPSIMETNNSQLVLCWDGSGGDRIRSYQPNGTLNWEQKLKDLGFSSRNPGVIQDLTGDLWVTGIYNNELGAQVKYAILKLSSQTGSIKQQMPSIPQSFPDRPIASRTEPDSSLVFCVTNPVRLVRFKYDLQGVIIEQDTVKPADLGIIYSVDMHIPDKVLLLRNDNLFSNPGNISVQPLTLNASTIALDPVWKFTVDNPFNHEVFEAWANARDGGVFVLFRGKPHTVAGYSSGYYIMKYMPDGQLVGPVFLGDEPINFSQNKQLQVTKDEGVLVRAENDKTWKLDQNLQIEWVKETAYGRLFAGAENDFFVVPYLSQP
ncbi:MAG: hypothetical protein JNN28_11640, partial [Saprospiraceae bacterium]|nr:hypothetical protein [Saprospiraceae bacterium]